MSSLLAPLLQLSAFVPLLKARRALHGTTLLHAWPWAAAAMIFWPVCTLAQAALGGEHPATSHLHYSAAALTLCPLVAVLGACRPRMQAWHFVVAALLVVLLIPALQSPLRQREPSPLRLEDLPTLLFLGLTAVGLGNYAPTRFGPSALLAASSLTLLVLDLSPWAEGLPAIRSCRGWASWGIPASAWVAWGTAIYGRRPIGPAWQRVWIDFRDLYGLVWAKRVQERFNAASRQLGWPLLLTWRGFVPPPADDLNRPGPMRTGLLALLLRFVSEPWIEEHLGPDANRARTSA